MYRVFKGTSRDAWWLGCGVVSHWFALTGWLIRPWGSWIDRTRRSDLA